jgi:hypothetical protein
MSNPTIDFRRQRELGDVISDTFKFIRQEFKPLIKTIFKITGPVFVILLLAIGYYSYLGMDLLANPFLADASEVNVEMYFISLFILFSSLLAFYVLLYNTILHYIRSYMANAGIVNDTEVFEGVKRDFGRMLGLLLLAGIMTGVGLLLCILPGVYLWVPMALTPAIMVFGRNSILDSIGQAFDLIKNNWWNTFFTLFVITLLVYIIGMIFQFPLMVYYFIKTLTMSTEGSAANPADLVDWVYVFFNVISSLFQYLLSTIVVISTAFIYYSLDEKKNATGSFERISNLGS